MICKLIAYIAFYARSVSIWYVIQLLWGIHFPAHDRKAYAAMNYTTAEPGYPISNLISGFGCNSLGPQMSETHDYKVGVRIPKMNLHTFTFTGFQWEDFFPKDCLVGFGVGESSQFDLVFQVGIKAEL